MTESYDLVVRGGTVIDGSGADRFVADVAVRNGWICAVGEVPGKGVQEIDARELLVTPGFVDIHTHYDGQAIWSERLTPSSDHGVTTVVTGNCGVGFAPARREDHAELISLMEGVEDVPGVVMTTGLDWSWESFPEFLDAIDRRAHDIDIAVYLPHSPLRVYVMGRRALDREPANAEDLVRIRELTREALEAGALGVGSSQVVFHRTSKGELIPSYGAQEAEYLAIADALRETGSGVMQFVGNTSDEQGRSMLERIARRSGRPLTFSTGQMPKPQQDEALERLRRLNNAGVVMKAQLLPRPGGYVIGLRSTIHPFSMLPSFAPLRDLPLAEKVARMRDPELRARLIAETSLPLTNPVHGLASRLERIFPLGPGHASYEPDPDSGVAGRARREGRAPAEVAYDMLLEDEGRALLLIVTFNYEEGNLDFVETMLKDRNIVAGLGDGGAHYGMVCDASYTTSSLTHWTRDRTRGRFTLEEMVHNLSRKPAEVVGLLDRGLVAEGYRGHLNVIDHDRLAVHLPEVVHDLPGGGQRMHQRADGYVATIVSGEVIARNGLPTHARPGRLIRGSQQPRP